MVIPFSSNSESIENSESKTIETIDYKITKISSKFSNYFGYKQEELVGTCIFSFLKTSKKEIEKIKNSPTLIKKFEIQTKWGVGKEILLIKITIDEEKSFFVFKEDFREDLLTVNGFDLYIDKLTGLQNKYAFNKELNSEINFFATFIELKNYSNVLTFYGEDFSNGVLRDLSIKIKESYDITDIFRVSEDVFCIIKKTETYPNLESFEKEIEFKIKEIFAYFLEKECPITLDYVLGFAEGKGRDVFNNSRMALQYAKELGIKKYTYNKNFFRKVQESYIKEADIYLKIKAAIQENRVIPFYQPIHDNRSKSIKKYECLARIREPNGDFMLPSVFIDIAKKQNLNNDITKSIINHAFEYFKEHEDISFSINLHFQALIDCEMFYFILNKVEEFPYKHNIIFEVIESEAMPLELFESNNLIQILRSKGCKFALDDFGSGYSNLSMLSYFNYDYLKIDGSLIINIHKPESYKTIKTITELAQHHNVEVVAEWVKDEEIQTMVDELKIDYSQGYHFGKPEQNILEKSH